ncbi:hypothetical protein C0991_008659, partial [Blastosporella zonata]
MHKSKSRHPHILPRASSNCTTGGLYKSPTSSSSLDSLQPIIIQWDSSCLSSQKLDIHLLAPWYNGATTEMTVWSGVNNADGQKSVTIMPKWWNDTSEVKVQLAIVEAGTLVSMTPLPAGPVWTATYTKPSDGSTPASADMSSGDSSTTTTATKTLAPGKTAAAVIMTLLAVGALVFLYFRYQRKKSAQKSQRFSVAVDKRMSTISTDWKSMSAAGAQAAIRNSIAVNRDSSAFSFGAIRPTSTYSATTPADDDGTIPQMQQVRTGTGVGLRHPAGAAAFAAERQSRVSRVSFADTVGRPSGESRRTRAFHSAYVPPVPTRVSVYPDGEDEKSVPEDDVKTRKSESEESAGTHGTLSPRQNAGPLTLTPEDIRARIQGQGRSTNEYDEVMPALSSATYAPTSPALSPPPSAFTLSAYDSAPSPTTNTNTGMAPPLPVMSPDDMLRAYAVRKSTGPAPSSFTTPASPKAKGRKL